MLTPLTFARLSLKSVGCFYFRCVPSQWKAVTVDLRILRCQFKRHFWRPVVTMCLATSNNLLVLLQDATKRIFFLRTRDLLVSQKTTQRHFCSTIHPLFTVIFAAATVLAFVLLRDSRFNLHCCTQREATPTQKSAWKSDETSRDFLRERLQLSLIHISEPTRR